MIETQNNHNLLISIATPCWNSAKTIERTIKSVLAQEFKDYEYIIVDGGSTDGTIDIIKKYEPLFEGRMKWISEPDKGLYDAFNKGIERSVGRYCWNVNSDDYIEPDALSKLYEIINNQADDTVIVGSMYLVDEEGNKKKLAISTDENTQRAYYSDYMINHAATIVPHAIYDKYGTFDVRFKICADLDWFHRCYKNGVKFYNTDAILTNFSLGGISTSSIYKKESADKWLYYKKNFNIIRAILKYVKWHKTFLGNKRRLSIIDNLETDDENN